MHVRRRPADVADRSFLRRVHHDAFRDVVERQFGAWDEQRQDRFFDDEWGRHDREIVLCDDEPAGYLAVEIDERDIVIHEIVLDPAFHSRGIGTQIIADVLDDARRSRKTVRLQVLLLNRARALYERVGFHEVSRSETHIVMEWHASD